MNNKSNKVLYLPTIPYTPIDLANRIAASRGSVRYAAITANADYNGHYVTVAFRPHAVGGPRWVAEYWWAGRNVLGRGSFASALKAALTEYRRGALGTQVAICLDPQAPEPLDEQEKLAREAGAVDEDTLPWWSGAHDAVADAVNWEKHGFVGLVPFAFLFTGTKEEWPAARDRWLKERGAAR